MSIRIERIGEQVREELSRLLRDEVSDPRIGMLSLTRVEVARGLDSAMVFWSPLDVRGERDLGEVAAGLASASGFLRRRLAQELSLRHTPELRFRHDPSIEQGSSTLALLRRLEEQRKKTAGSEASDPRSETPE